MAGDCESMFPALPEMTLMEFIFYFTVETKIYLNLSLDDYLVHEPCLVFMSEHCEYSTLPYTQNHIYIA